MDEGRKVRKISSVRDLEVYRLAFDTAMEVFKITKSFPTEEKYSLTDQIRRSSSLCVSIFPKPGGSEDIRQYLLISYQIQNKKRQKHKPGWNLPGNVDTLTRISLRNWMRSMNTYSLCFTTWGKKWTRFADNGKGIVPRPNE